MKERETIFRKNWFDSFLNKTEAEDLKAEYQARLDVIKEYAPKMMSPEEIEEVLKTQFADVIATKNKGQIMKAVMAELKGKANGKDINQIVGKLCQ